MTFLVKQVVPVITFCEGENSSRPILKWLSEIYVSNLFINLKTFLCLQFLKMIEIRMETPLKNAVNTIKRHPLWKKSICIGNMED